MVPKQYQGMGLPAQSREEKRGFAKAHWGVLVQREHKPGSGLMSRTTKYDLLTNSETESLIKHRHQKEEYVKELFFTGSPFQPIDQQEGPPTVLLQAANLVN
ncbi:hypothetical protein NQZ68_011313 [Dissostichus eleginoides]|nr:hypothetical protein NQZ68_011313 [Dissostichus eleginoides]